MNRTVKIWLTFFLLGVGTLGLAQNPEIKRTWHWYFGYGAGLDFSSGTAVSDPTSSIHTEEACFTMSDTSGNLLFYGNYDTIWTKNHTFMVNGNLNKPTNPTQMMCVPQPGNDSLYYVVYTDGASAINKLWYAIVNMNMNAGLGEVIFKDSVLIADFASEKVTATLHCNGTDIWIVGKRHTNNILLAWLLSPSGLNPTPVVSPVAITGQENGSSHLKFSPDGSMLAAAYINVDAGDWEQSTVEIYQFDNCSGTFSNPIILPFECPTGLCFSPDNSKLYACMVVDCYWIPIPPADTGHIIQYDVSNYIQASILNSATVVASGAGKAYNGLQIAPDGKIYVTDMDTFNIATFGMDSVGVINNPNASGIACDFQENKVGLTGKWHCYNFPQYLESYFNGLESGREDFQAMKPVVSYYPNPARDYITVSYPAAEDIVIQCFDMLGHLHFKRILTHKKRSCLDISYLPPGVYIFIVTSSKENKPFYITSKIIKL